MELGGLGQQRLREALVDAFPSRDQLKQWVKDHLNQNIQNIVADKTLRDQVFDLIGWAESESNLPWLIEEAHKARPCNKKLRTFRTNLRQHQALLGVLPNAQAFEALVAAGFDAHINASEAPVQAVWRADRVGGEQSTLFCADYPSCKNLSRQSSPTRPFQA